MTRKRLLLLLSLGCLVVSIAAYSLWPYSSAINEANARRLKSGMSFTEVRDILGGPPRDESTGPLAYAESDDDVKGKLEFDAMRDFFPSIGGQFQAKGLCEECVQHEWISNTVVVQIEFIDGKAVVPMCYPVRRVYETPWAMLRRWLKF